MLSAICYNRPVLRIVLTLIALAGAAAAQQESKPQQPPGQPPVKLNYINACSPSTEDQAQIKSVFARVGGRLAFSRDFEVTRGRVAVKDAPDAKYVRLRRDMAPESALLAAQYSISTDATATVETLVLRSRDEKDFHELALEDAVSAGAASPATLLKVSTPVNRIRVERIGKGSIVLSRCQEADQSAFEPLFRQASDIMALYRKALGLGAIQSDIAWMSMSTSTASSPATASPRKAKAPAHTPAATPK
jgi:hypothetical protein